MGRPQSAKGSASRSQSSRSIKPHLKKAFKKSKMTKGKGTSLSGSSKGIKSTDHSNQTIKPRCEVVGPDGEETSNDTATSESASSQHAKKHKTIPMSKKERRESRRRRREDYVLTSETKNSWERLRRHQLIASERKELMEKLMSSIAGQIHQLSVKHDTARVIQCCLKYGTRGQRSSVFSELKDHIVELSKLKYAKFTVKSLLKYCTSSERGHVISCLYGHVRRLVRHSEAAEILEIAYNDYANADQRASLVREFYGPQFSLFKDDSGPIALTEILKDKPELKTTIMKHLKETVLPLLEKKVVHHSIVHRALLDFFLNCSTEERSEMVEAVREVVVHMLHTKEGSRVAMTTLWHGTAKDRKAVLKSFKSYVAKICKEEHGHLVMMALFDSVDDTVMVKKIILSEMTAALEELCDDPFGRRVLLYLLTPRSPTHFSPQFITVLSAGDGNAHSKKDPLLRQTELREGIITPLLHLAGEKACSWARSKCHAPLLLQIADSASSDPGLYSLYSVMLEELCRDFDSEDHLVVNASAHWVLKRLLTHERKGKGLANLILEKVSPEQLILWAGSNRAAFVLCALVHHLDEQSPAHHKMTAMLRETLTSSSSLKGQQALLKELNNKS